LNVQAAEARQHIAAKNVGDGTIRSPFTGVVTERFIEVGEYVQPSSRVVALAEVDDLQLEFSVPEQHYAEVKVGAAVQFAVAAYNGVKFDGEVTRISGAVRATRDIVVEARVKNTEGKLLPGMFADVGLVVGSERLPRVPASAVFDKVGKSNVFVVKDGALEQRVLQPALVGNDFVSVRQGVKPGEMVVTANLDTLQNGQPVVE
jgi:membrane fusion protein (multidrug efflux system)